MRDFELRTSWIVALLLAAIGLLANEHAALAGIIDSDDASATAYDDGWDNFDDGSINANGLGGWVFGGGIVSGTNAAIASSAGNGGATTIDASGESFKLHDTGGNYIDMFRFFDPSGLNPGETFAMDIDVNFRGGFKGMDLRDPSESTIFNFNIGGDDYTVGSAASGNGSIGDSYSNDTVFHLEFTQATLASGSWSITRSGGIADFDSGTYSGRARSIKLYSGSQGGSAEDAIYYNNLVITGVPEPATLTLMVCGLAGIGFVAARRKPL